MIIKWVLVYLAMIGTDPAATAVKVFDEAEQCALAMQHLGQTIDRVPDNQSKMLLCMPAPIRMEEEA